VRSQARRLTSESSLLADETEKRGKVVKFAGIKVDPAKCPIRIRSAR
jgi:hypothetical protein